MTSNEIVLRVVESLTRAGVPYMLVGSYSSNAFGIPRSTQDADFVVEAQGSNLTRVFQELGPDIQVDPQLQLEMVTMTYRYVAVHRESGFKVEFFLVSDDAHDRARFQRRKLQPFLGSTAVLPSPEDVVVQKLRWALRARRAKDRDDVKAVLAVQAGKLDLRYIRSWCDRHGTSGLLDALLQEISGSGLPSQR